ALIQPMFERERREVSEQIRGAIQDHTVVDRIVPEIRASAAPTVVTTAPAPRSRRVLVGALVAAIALTIAATIVVALKRGGDHTAASASPPPAALTVPHDAPSLRICGSGTIGGELAPALIDAWLRSKGATNVMRKPGARTDEFTFAGASLVVDLRGHGTAT